MSDMRYDQYGSSMGWTEGLATPRAFDAVDKSQGAYGNRGLGSGTVSCFL